MAQIGGASPSRSGHACRAWCLISIVAGGCVEKDDPPRTCEPATFFRIDHVTVPATNNAARALAFDLNGDKSVDNQVGMIASTLQALIDVDFSIAATTRIDADVTWWIGVRECSDDSVDVSLSRAQDDAGLMTGTRVDGRIIAGGEGGELPMSTLFDPSSTFPDPGWMRGRRTMIQLDERATGGFDGHFGVGVDATQVFDRIAPPVLPYLNMNPMAVENIDADHDGTISFAELESYSITQSLLKPDIDATTISVGFGFTATAR